MKILYNKKQTAEKKNLINRISELTGVKPKYLGAPTMLYQIGPYQVDREGNLIAPDDQDAMELIEALKLYGFEESIPAGEEAEGPAQEQEPVAEQSPIAEETSVTEETLEETHTAEEAEAATAENIEEAFTEAPTEVPITADAEIAEATEAAEDAEAAETVEEAIPQNTAAEAAPVALSIAFPLSKHTSQSIRNLVNLIYSRGALVSKAVQGEFLAPQELVDWLGSKNAVTVQEEIDNIKEFEAENGVEIKGIRFEDGQVVFTGFPETADADILLAFQHLTEKMNKQAIEQKRIQARVVDEENEKYSMRTWLVRIGMGGSEYKKTRNLLMKHLFGHTAFKTQADAERWKAKQAALKAERKAAQEEAE